jgi:hypothetical protein
MIGKRINISIATDMKESIAIDTTGIEIDTITEGMNEAFRNEIVTTNVAIEIV